MHWISMYRLPFLNCTVYNIYTLVSGVKDTISVVWLNTGTMYPIFSKRQSMFNGMHNGN